MSSSDTETPREGTAVDVESAITRRAFASASPDTTEISASIRPFWARVFWLEIIE